VLPGVEVSPLVVRGSAMHVAAPVTAQTVDGCAVLHALVSLADGLALEAAAQMSTAPQCCLRLAVCKPAGISDPAARAAGAVVVSAAAAAAAALSTKKGLAQAGLDCGEA